MKRLFFTANSIVNSLVYFKSLTRTFFDTPNFIVTSLNTVYSTFIAFVWSIKSHGLLSGIFKQLAIVSTRCTKTVIRYDLKYDLMI